MATGLNFQTQTIINSQTGIDGKELFTFVDTNLIEDTSDKYVPVPYVLILRDFKFFKDGIQSIRYRAGYSATKAKVTVDLTDYANPTEKTYYRLDVYVGVEGAEPFIFANQWVQKGRPFWIELIAKKGEAAATMAARWADEIKKSKMFLIDKDIVNVSLNGAVITLEAAQEFLRFRKVELSVYDVNSEYAEKVTDLVENDNITLEEYGENSFGTYSQIVRDLRLPTAANTSWTHLRQEETPIVGAIYDQFIINYAAPAVNDGMQCVGQRMDSHTTHVFWVKHDVANQFMAVFNPTDAEADFSVPIINEEGNNVAATPAAETDDLD